MKKPIRVIVFKRKGRMHFEAQWVDPLTGKKKTRTTKQSRRRNAERVAGEFERELNSPEEPITEMAWAEFRECYESDYLDGKAEKTQQKNRSVLNSVEKVLNPRSVQDLNATQIARYSKSLRDSKRAALTIKGHLVIIGGLLKWAVRHNFLAKAPHITMPKKPTGRPIRQITTEEFERMLKLTPSIVGDDIADSWDFYLQGLWLSGLRLRESLLLSWDDQNSFCVDLSGKKPMFKIPAHVNKSRKSETLPLTPDFYELLQTVDPELRTGLVFNPRPLRIDRLDYLKADWISKIVSRIGTAAGVKTHDQNGKQKFATAHDFRRAFGFRWSQKVMPPVLMLLMRHASLDTTMKFYVGHQAEEAANTVWNACDLLEDENANTSC